MTTSSIVKAKIKRHQQQIARGRTPGQLGPSRIVSGDPAQDRERELRRRRQHRWYWKHRDLPGFRSSRKKGHAHV